MMMSPFKIILKPNLQYIPDFENPKNQKGHVISDSFLSRMMFLLPGTLHECTRKETLKFIKLP